MNNLELKLKRNVGVYFLSKIAFSMFSGNGKTGPEKKTASKL